MDETTIIVIIIISIALFYIMYTRSHTVKEQMEGDTIPGEVEVEMSNIATRLHRDDRPIDKDIELGYVIVYGRDIMRYVPPTVHNSLPWYEGSVITIEPGQTPSGLNDWKGGMKFKAKDMKLSGTSAALDVNVDHWDHFFRWPVSYKCTIDKKTKIEVPEKPKMLTDNILLSIVKNDDMIKMGLD